jgi:hypothetical protein
MRQGACAAGDAAPVSVTGGVRGRPPVPRGSTDFGHAAVTRRSMAPRRERWPVVFAIADVFAPFGFRPRLIGQAVPDGQVGLDGCLDRISTFSPGSDGIDTAEPDSPTGHALTLLASWAATTNDLGESAPAR